MISYDLKCRAVVGRLFSLFFVISVTSRLLVVCLSPQPIAPSNDSYCLVVAGYTSTYGPSRNATI